MLPFPTTLDNKPDWKRDDRSPRIKDLLLKDYNSSDSAEGLIGIDLFRVGKEEEMRPDLIARQAYGYLIPLEQLLKFNNISNPFAIQEGDVFTIWDIPSASSNLRPQTKNAEAREDIRKQYITPEKKSTVDPRLADFEKRTQATKPDPSKGKNAPALPPNLADFGDQEIALVNGKLVLGGAVSASGFESQDPVSKSEFVAKMIKQRLRNNT
jgi:hypothetical protein